MINELDFKCFLIQLSPFADRNSDTVKEFQEKSLDAGISGMGWAGDERFAKYAVGTSINDEIVLCKFGRKDLGISHAFSAYKRIRVGDYLLTRRKSCEDCYIGKVTQEATRFDDNSRYSWGVKCIWKKCGIFSELPNALRGLMSKRLPTIQEVSGYYEIAKQMIRDIYEEKNTKYILSEENFHQALAPFDLEDLVELYIENENPGFRIYASSCKPSEPLVEFVLTNEEVNITCQVKNIEQIDVGNYINLATRFKYIYLFSGIGKYYNLSSKPDNVLIISREKLYEFLKYNCLTKGHFFNLIDRYYIFQ